MKHRYVQKISLTGERTLLPHWPNTWYLLIFPFFFFFVSMRDTKVHTLVEDESCQSERVFPGTASSPASVSRGPRMTDGSQRSHVLNPVCRWTPVVVLNPAPGGSRESAERPIHHHADIVSHVGQLEDFLHCEPPPWPFNKQQKPPSQTPVMFFKLRCICD